MVKTTDVASGIALLVICLVIFVGGKTQRGRSVGPSEESRLRGPSVHGLGSRLGGFETPVFREQADRLAAKNCVVITGW